MNHARGNHCVVGSSLDIEALKPAPAIYCYWLVLDVVGKKGSEIVIHSRLGGWPRGC